MFILIGSNYHEHSTLHFAMLALKKMGHRALLFGPDMEGEGFIRTPDDVSVNEILAALPEKPDLYLAVETHRSDKIFVPRDIDKLGIPAVCWAIDTHLNFSWHREFARLFDRFYVAQKDMLPWLSDYGIRAEWLPLACLSEIHTDLNIDREFDIGFVGNMTEKRKHLFDYLKREMPDLKFCIRQGLFGRDLALLYSRARIVVNPSAKKDLNMRAFEAAACGAFLINEDIRAGLQDIFAVGEDVDVYPEKDLAALVKKIRNRLADYSDTLSRARAARDKIVREHTYEKRMSVLISDLDKKKAGERYVYLEASKASFYLHKKFLNFKIAAGCAVRGARSNPFLFAFYLARNYYMLLIERKRKLMNSWPY